MQDESVFAQIRQFFSAPVFDVADKTRNARLIGIAQQYQS
jgi:hypothetical protein